MRILAFSDLHCDLNAAARIVDAADEADLVIGAGDFAQLHQGLEATMAALKSIEEKSLFIPGNNETHEALLNATSARVLHGESVEIDGNTIACIGGAVPPLPPTAWNSYDISEAEVARMLAPIQKADILVTHSPPQGHVDLHAQLGHLGSTSIAAWIEQVQPQLVFCGHIHDCWGQTSTIGKSRIHNLGPGTNWFEI